ncbi:hypothetical protein ON010_g11522 [Phytophthora cinnamomi]|nr:hypothetical protein ON010_g11522 [Phytophthora cinnamomi]
MAHFTRASQAPRRSLTLPRRLSVVFTFASVVLLSLSAAVAAESDDLWTIPSSNQIAQHRAQFKARVLDSVPDLVPADVQCDKTKHCGPVAAEGAQAAAQARVPPQFLLCGAAGHAQLGHQLCRWIRRGGPSHGGAHQRPALLAHGPVAPGREVYRAGRALVRWGSAHRPLWRVQVQASGRDDRGFQRDRQDAGHGHRVGLGNYWLQAQSEQHPVEGAATADGGTGGAVDVAARSGKCG